MGFFYRLNRIHPVTSPARRTKSVIKNSSIRVRLVLHSGVVGHGILFQKNEVIDSVMCYNIWVKFDAILEMEDMMIKDDRILSMDVLAPERSGHYQGHLFE